jgi:hypothetical protein
MNYVNHSGGAIGADTEWENEGLKYGVKTIAYSFIGHSCRSKTPCILSESDLMEGFEHAKIASTALKRPLDYIALRRPYTKNLISRNWFQVKHAECVFAVGTFVKNSNNLVNGGTGWAVQMAIDDGKPVYLFDQNEGDWYKFAFHSFFHYLHTPTLTRDFAGIGTREINAAGIQAIKAVYANTFRT